jgi:hypothetical protein
MPNSMSPFLNRLIAFGHSSGLVSRIVVLLLDQIDIVGVQYRVRDVRDLVRAFRVSFGSHFSSFMHRNGLHRCRGRTSGEHARYCVYLT